MPCLVKFPFLRIFFLPISIPPLFQSTPWSKTKEKKAKKAARRLKKQLKAQHVEAQASSGAATMPAQKAGRKRPMSSKNDDDDDDDDLMEDYKKMKKHRGKKVGSYRVRLAILHPYPCDHYIFATFR